MSKRKEDARFYLNFVFDRLCSVVNRDFVNSLDTELHSFLGSLNMASYAGIISEEEHDYLRTAAWCVAYGI